MENLTEAEYRILCLLWTEDRPLTAVEVNELLPDKTWKSTSTHPILNSMMAKEVIEVQGIVKSGRTYGRKFGAAITPEEYSLRQIRENTACAKDQDASIVKVFASLVEEADISDDTIQKIEELIAKKKKGGLE